MGRYMQAVSREQTLVVTRRGKPLAKVSAAPPDAHPGENVDGCVEINMTRRGIDFVVMFVSHILTGGMWLLLEQGA